MYERILVPTDGSGAAEAAMDNAIDLAGRYDATIHVVHVIDSGHYDTSIDSAVAPLRERGQEYIDRLVGVADAAGMELTTAVEIGRPAHHILEYVDEHDVDLIVMGTRGKGGLPRRLLGSVTDYIVTHAGVPVHVVPPVDESD